MRPRPGQSKPPVGAGPGRRTSGAGSRAGDPAGGHGGPPHSKGGLTPWQRRLRLAGLVTVEQRGKNRICGIDNKAVAELQDYLGGRPTDDGRRAPDDCCD